MSVRDCIRDCIRDVQRGVGYALQRYFRAGNGSDTYGTLAEPIPLASGDTFTMWASNPAALISAYAFDGDATGVNRAYLSGDISGNIVWDATKFSAVTIDGVAATNGVTAFPSDGVLHEYAHTANAAGVIGRFWSDYTATAGHSSLTIEKFAHTPIAGVPLVYDLRNDSLLYQQAVGYEVGDSVVTGDNSTFDTSVGDWAGDAGVTISRDTTVFTDGGIKLVTDGTAPRAAALALTGLTVGVAYKVTTTGYSPSSNTVVNGAVISADNNNPSTSTDESAQVTAEDVEQPLECFFTATATTATLYLLILNRGVAWGSAGDVAYFDNIKFEPIPKALLYTNFTAGDIEQYVFNSATNCWEAVGVAPDLCVAY